MSEEKKGLHTFGLSREEVDRDLSYYYRMINVNASKRSNILKFWCSVEDYVDALYIIKFVRKIPISEMDSFTGIHHFNSDYLGLNWHYLTNDFDECREMYYEELRIYDNYRADAREETSLYETETFIEFNKKMKGFFSLATLRHADYPFGIEMFVKELYYLWSEKNLNYAQLAIALNLNSKLLGDKFKKAGLNRTRTESQLAANRAGRRNYNESLRKGRRTLSKKVLEQGLIGSAPENAFRTALENMLVERIPAENYEIIVGLNSRSIVTPLEVDIPIVIIEKKGGALVKIAIEVDGSIWHKERDNDTIKEQKLNKQGWHVLRILYDQKATNSTRVLEERFNEAIDSIVSLLKNSDKKE